jgi:hypothetical protein
MHQLLGPEAEDNSMTMEVDDDDDDDISDENEDEKGPTISSRSGRTIQRLPKLYDGLASSSDNISRKIKHPVNHALQQMRKKKRLQTMRFGSTVFKRSGLVATKFVFFKMVLVLFCRPDFFT